MKLIKKRLIKWIMGDFTPTKYFDDIIRKHSEEHDIILEMCWTCGQIVKSGTETRGENGGICMLVYCPKCGITLEK